MCSDIVTLLKHDHRRFESLFVEVARQCDLVEAGMSPDRPRLNAVVGFLRDRVLPVHHALEDVIYIMLLRNYPQICEVYDLAEDHQQSKREFDAFADAVKSGEESFVDVARSYIGNERAHFIAEEEVLFPYAEKYLQPVQWQDLKRSVEIKGTEEAEPLNPDIEELLQTP